jgi:SAM-dependent methyltransferase
MAVFFDVWFPESDHVSLVTHVCELCGFLVFFPRPTEDDLERKYRFLRENQKEPLGGQAATKSAVRGDAARARRMYRSITTVQGTQSQGVTQRLLDFGGGTGKLLAPFLAAGYQCDLVDYCDRPLPNVRKIADRLEELTARGEYDVVVCSHVLEHVADPGAVLQRLADHLRPQGVLYAEVPMEVFGGIPIRWDPVTHVNYFNPWNLAALVIQQGFVLSNAGRIVTTYNGGRIEAGVVLALRQDRPAPEIASDLRPLYHRGRAEAQSSLRPSFVRRIGRRMRLRQWPRLRNAYRAVHVRVFHRTEA